MSSSGFLRLSAAILQDDCATGRTAAHTDEVFPRYGPRFYWLGRGDRVRGRFFDIIPNVSCRQRVPPVRGDRVPVLANGRRVIFASATDLSTSYFTDALLRPERVSANASSDDGAASAEVLRILLNDAAKGEVPEGDKAYIASIVTARTADRGGRPGTR